MEVWKDIKGYEGMYKISSYGNVMSLKKSKPRILKPCANDRGYLLICLCKNGHIKTQRMARLVAKAFIANPDKLPEVNHKDGNVLNNNVNNLEWVSRRENNTHMCMLYKKSSKYPYVSKYGKNRWIANITINNKSMSKVFNKAKDAYDYAVKLCKRHNINDRYLTMN